MTILRRKSGFTLLEMIMVIALLGVATTFGVTMLFKISDAWRKTSVRCELDNRAEHIFKSIRQDMAEMLSPSATGLPLKIEAGTGTFEVDKPVIKVQVERDRFLVPTKLTMRDDPKAELMHVDVEYAVESKEGVCRLIRIERLPGEAENKWKRSELDNAVISFHVETLDREPGAAWQSGWAKATAPRAVRVSVVLANPNNPLDQIVRMAVFSVEVD